MRWGRVGGDGERVRLREELGFEMRFRLYIAYGSGPEVGLWVGLYLWRRAL